MQIFTAMDGRRTDDRRGRRDHRARHRPAEERDVPDDGSRRASTSLPHVARDLSDAARIPPSSQAFAIPACRRAAGAPRLGRRQGRPRLLPEDARPATSMRSTSADGVPAVGAARASRRSMRREASRSPASASATLFVGKDKRRRVPARDARADAALRRPHRRRRSPVARRHRSRDALGLRLGARPVRDAAARSASTTVVAALGTTAPATPRSSDVPASADDPRADARPTAAPVGRAPGTGVVRRRTPAPAWSISATACSASSSIRR